MDPLVEFTAAIGDNMILRGCRLVVERLGERYGEEYRSLARDVLELGAGMGWDCEAILTDYMVDYLRHQHDFMKKGDYGAKRFEDIKATVYDNHSLMCESYMPGNFLSYAFTPLMYARYHFFVERFLPLLRDGGDVVEIGFGGGFYLWNILRRRESAEKTSFPPRGGIRGFDISAPALEFATGLLEKMDLLSDRVFLSLGDVRQGIAVNDASVDLVLLSEVIEHLPEPAIAIREAARIMKRDGKLYLTTVIDSNHMDHITNFESEAAVAALIEQEGLRIAHDMVFRMTDVFPEIRDQAVGLGYICVKAE